jgi:nitroimidazol reductase NimA-like FMN-containing flavoprotein (pyridoxamine 5'-phosphate oxidase superfamily)
MSTKASRLTPEEWARAEALLREAPVAYIAVSTGDGPFVVPMNFAYQPHAEEGARPETAAGPGLAAQIFVHTGMGRKSAALAEDPRVCLVIAADESFDQGTSPCSDGFAFRSVMVEGRATLLQDAGEREQALRAIVAKYDPDAVDRPFKEKVFARTLVYAITIESVGYKERPRRGTA